MHHDIDSAKDNSSNIEKSSFYYLLSPSDQLQYQALQRRLSSTDNRYNRNKRIEVFKENLDEIKRFCLRNDEDDWKRFIACGICWIDDGICVNTRQIRILFGKSKSAINGALQLMGYDTTPPKGNDAAPLIEAIPFLKDNFAEQRQWSIRKCSKQLETPVKNNESPVKCCHGNHTKDDNHPNTDSSNLNTRTPCAFGCTCGCDCKINGEATRPCICIYPDDSYEYGKGVCHCEKIAGMAQVQPILIDESIEGPF